MAPKRVVHLTSAHRPEDTRIHWRQCASLADAGFDVHLVAQAPAPESSAPGVTVHPFDSPDGGRLKRATAGVSRGVATALDLNPALIHLHDPELLGALPFLKARSDAVIVMDLHEDISLQLRHKPWLPEPVARVAAPLSRMALRASAPLVDLYVVAWPHPNPATPLDRTIEVHNYPSREEFNPGTSITYAERPMSVVSVGTVTEQRCLVEILQAAVQLRDTAQFTLAGPVMPESLLATHEDLIKSSGACLTGRLDRDGVNGLLDQARVGLCLLYPSPQYQVAEPTKLFEYLLAGVPVVGCNFGPTKQILDAHGCGITVDPLDPNAIAAATNWILENESEASVMAAKARTVSTDYVWELQADELVGAYRQLLGD